jgi:hypothetical protein
LPGFALAYFTSSAAEPAGTDGFTASRCGEYMMIVTGAKSLMMSNGRFVITLGVITRLPTSISTIVWPSGGDFATRSAPMLPEAPGLLSTITGWPRPAGSSARTAVRRRRRPATARRCESAVR